MNSKDAIKTLKKELVLALFIVIHIWNLHTACSV